MENPFKNYQVKPTKKTSERAELIGEFLDILNADRKGYKPLTAARVGMMLRFIGTKDLYSFLSECKYASHFGKYFWSRFKQLK